MTWRLEVHELALILYFVIMGGWVFYSMFKDWGII